MNVESSKIGPRRLRPSRGAVVVEVAFRVPFHDVDSMRVAWHGNYFKYFEFARTALERRLDLEIPTLEAFGYVFPVIESYCRHLSPLRFDDQARVRAWIAGADRKLTVGYEVLNDTTGMRAAEGSTVQVALRAGTHELQMEIPDEVLDRVRRVLGAAPGIRGPR